MAQTYYSTAEAAKYLGKSEQSVRSYVKAGLLRASRVGLKVLQFKKEDLDDFAQGRPIEVS